MTEEEKAVFASAKNAFGEVNQINVAIEEMSELQKELCKFLRGGKNKLNIAEELADVRIMLDQLELIFKIDEECTQFRKYKIARLSNRVQAGDYLG